MIAVPKPFPSASPLPKIKNWVEDRLNMFDQVAHMYDQFSDELKEEWEIMKALQRVLDGMK